MANKDLPIQPKLIKIYEFIAKKELLLAFAVTVIVVAFGLFIGWENNKVVPINPDPQAHYLQEPTNVLSFMSDWDGPHYLQIAKGGYSNFTLTQFFPLYPILIHTFSYIIDSPLLIALTISWISLALAIYFYIKIIKFLFRIKNNLEALKGVLFFILFPSGVVLLATYTESLFAFLALGAIYFTIKKRLLPAALLTMLATATHIYGIFVLILIGLILIEQRESISKIFLTLFYGSLGLISYIIFLQHKFNSPLEFLTAQKTQGWLNSNYLSHLTSSFSIIDIPVLILLAVSVVYWWKRKMSFSIYSFLFLCIPFIGGQFNGFVRYAIMAFPFQLMLYEHFRKRETAYTLIVGTFCIFWCYFLVQYAGGYTGAGG